MSLSLEERVDVDVGSEEWEERFLGKLLVRLKETVKEKAAGVPQSGASGSGPSSSQSEGGKNLCWLVLVVMVWCGCIVGGVLVSV